MKWATSVALLVGASPAFGDERAEFPSASVMKGLFGSNFKQLNAQPEGTVTNTEETDKVLNVFAECPSLATGADDFEIADCQRARAELRASTTPVFVELRVGIDSENVRYDFRQKGWVIAFDDELANDNVTLSVWKPTMLERLEQHAKPCEDGVRTCYPQNLPQKFRPLKIFIPMSETEARALRDSGVADGDLRRELFFLVSIRRGTDWSKKYERPYEPSRQGLHQGVLAFVHAMRVRLGSRSWSFPDWYSAP